jgi:hypothetical protein
MSRRPLPNIPRAAIRRRPRPAELLLACPRTSPEWELGALRALIKPQTKGAIIHRDGRQTWPADAEAAVRRIAAEVERRLVLPVELHLPDEGEYFFLTRIPFPRQTDGLAFAAALSTALPDLWFTYGRLYLRSGKFYRRERGVKLWLVEASNVHLPRELRAALRDMI